MINNIFYHILIFNDFNNFDKKIILLIYNKYYYLNIIF